MSESLTKEVKKQVDQLNPLIWQILAIILVIILTLFSDDEKMHAQDESDYILDSTILFEAFRAGTVLILDPDTGTYGQGSLELKNDGVIHITTIQHVVSAAMRGDTDLIIAIPGYTDGTRVEADRFDCPELNDPDGTCSMALVEAASDYFFGSSEYAPFYYQGDTLSLRIGDLVATPRFDTGRWTIGHITEIRDDEIIITTTHGVYCHGRSGGPAVLIRMDGGRVSLLTYRGWPVTIGTVQDGVGRGFPDPVVGTDNTCYNQVAIDRW